MVISISIVAHLNFTLLIRLLAAKYTLPQQRVYLAEGGALAPYVILNGVQQSEESL